MQKPNPPDNKSLFPELAFVLVVVVLLNAIYWLQNYGHP